MREPGLVQWLPVERGGLNVLVVRGLVERADCEHTPVLKRNLDLIEDRTSNVVSGAAGAHGIEAHGAEDVPRRHGAPVLIAGNAHQARRVPDSHRLTHPPLRHPGLARIIVEVGNVKNGFVPLGVIADQSRCIRELG